MSSKKQADNSPRLSAAARSAIVSSYVNALNVNDTTGSLVTQVCDVANKYARGEAICDEDRSAIVQEIARAKSWRGKSALARTSECNVVLKAYNKLGECVESFTNRMKKCQWHDTMKMARRLNRGDSVVQAVRFAMQTKTASASTPSQRAAGALKSWGKAEPKRQDVILKAASILGLKNFAF